MLAVTPKARGDGRERMEVVARGSSTHPLRELAFYAMAPTRATPQQQCDRG